MAENTRVELFPCQCRSPLCRVLWTETEDMDGEVSRVIEFPVCISPVGISENHRRCLTLVKRFYLTTLSSRPTVISKRKTAQRFSSSRKAGVLFAAPAAS